MSAPQPPADRDPASEADPTAPSDSAAGTGSDASSGSGGGTYDFHGEKLDFDPYRFGAPESTTPTWGDPTAPPLPPGQTPAPGERWTPGSGAGTPDVRPGDYWQGAGSQPRGGDVFPPAGYTPPAGGRIDLDKGPSTPDQPSGYPAPPAAGYPPPSYPQQGYPAPGGYPAPPRDAQNAKGGNGLAVAGFVVGLVGILLAFFTWPGIVVGLVGLGLAIPGLVRARRGAPMKGLALAGVICSAIAVVLGTVLLVVVLSRVDLDCVRNANGNFSQAQECVK